MEFSEWTVFPKTVPLLEKCLGYVQNAKNVSYVKNILKILNFIKNMFKILKKNR